MGRGLTAGQLALLTGDAGAPFSLLALALSTGTLYYTNAPAPVSYGGNTYTSRPFKVGNVVSTVNAAQSVVQVTLSDVDSAESTAFLAANYRGRTATLWVTAYKSDGTIETPMQVVSGYMGGAVRLIDDPVQGTSQCTVQITSSVLATTRTAGCRANRDSHWQSIAQAATNTDTFWLPVASLIGKGIPGGGGAAPPPQDPGGNPPGGVDGGNLLPRNA